MLLNTRCGNFLLIDRFKYLSELFSEQWIINLINVKHYTLSESFAFMDLIRVKYSYYALYWQFLITILIIKKLIII